MGLGCGASCMKVTLIIFNVIFFICGAAVLGIGIWLHVDPTVQGLLGNFVADNSNSDPLWKAATIVLMVIGAATFVVGIFGFCGACRESPCMLATYGSLLVIILIGEIVGGILAAVFKSKITDGLHDIMTQQIPAVMPYYANTSAAAATNQAWHLMQSKLKCCGADNYTNYAVYPHYQAPNGPVPITCCVLSTKDYKENPEPVDKDKCMAEALKTSGADASYLHTQGCHEAFVDWFDDKAIILIGIGVGIGLFQILGIVFAFCLRKSIQDGDSYN